MKVKNRRLRRKLEDVMDELSELDSNKVFAFNREVEDMHQRSVLKLVNSTFHQWFEDLTDKLPEKVYAPEKVNGLAAYQKAVSDALHPLSDVLPFDFAGSLYTDADKELFKDYRNEAVVHIPSASASIYMKNDSGTIPIARVDSCMMHISEDFILGASKKCLRDLLLSVTYMHFLCDELDFTRGLEG